MTPLSPSIAALGVRRARAPGGRAEPALFIEAHASASAVDGAMLDDDSGARSIGALPRKPFTGPGPAKPLDDSYVEDHDNQIDIVLSGDEAAIATIKAVQIPASGSYSPFYNPGGPGNNPTPGVTYSQPGPSQTESVINALANPMTVTYLTPGSAAAKAEKCDRSSS